jgi:hypothetical protein
VQLADAIARFIDQILVGRSRKVGTVSGTSGTQVIVSVDGSTVTLPRLASYTPTVGDIVHIDTTGAAWLVIGKTA